MASGTRPRTGLLVYGSLVVPSELRELCRDGVERAVPVRVDGLRRVFDQETSWRSDHPHERAVCNVVRDPESWINGLVLPDVSRETFSGFREREKWYRLIGVPRSDVELYRGSDEDALAANDVILTTTGTETDDDIEPIPDYVDQCVNGASEWPATFHEDFLRTTETNSGRSLEDYLE